MLKWYEQYSQSYIEMFVSIKDESVMLWNLLHLEFKRISFLRMWRFFFLFLYLALSRLFNEHVWIEIKSKFQTMLMELISYRDIEH